MKSLKYLIILSLIAAIAVSCEKGLDPIDTVAPGADSAGPTLKMTYPVEGTQFVSPDSVATITFKFVAEDDIELKSVTMELDGTVLETFTTFMDYRRADVQYDYEYMDDGAHNFKVTVVDKTDKSVSNSVNFSKITAAVYEPLEGEVAYFPLNGFYLNLIAGNSLTVVGTPGFAAGKVSDAYAGATDAYLTYPMTGMTGSEFSVAFWYKINAEPARAGIIAISPPTDPTVQDRTSGFRLFRENDGDNQKIGLNIGIGTIDVWMNPFITVPPDEDWMHIAISISATHVSIYVNGESMNETDLEAPISWANANKISIASGMPNFTYWDHFSDLSLYDEMHFFKKAISLETVQSLYNVKKK